MSGEMDIQWRRTWDDDLERDDFTGWDGERRIGRIYADSVGDRHFWSWFPAWPHAGRSPVESRRLAMLALEEAYIDLITNRPDHARMFFRN